MRGIPVYELHNATVSHILPLRIAGCQEREENAGRQNDRNDDQSIRYDVLLENILLQRFEEELDVLRKKHGEVDRDALVVKLLLEEFSFTTVEVADLPALKSRQRDWGKVYLLGESHFCQTPPSANVDMTTLTPKVKI